MKNEKKISVLEKAIQMLENGFPYNWKNTESCNCGVVAKSMGWQGERAGLGHGSWDRLTADRGCPITGLGFCEIQSKFVEAGFTKQEIYDLEILSDKSILKRSGIKTYLNYYQQKPNLIAYLRAWVQILREQDSKEQSKEVKPKVEVRYVTVRVDNSIFEQSKELIKN